MTRSRRNGSRDKERNRLSQWFGEEILEREQNGTLSGEVVLIRVPGIGRPRPVPGYDMPLSLIDNPREVVQGSHAAAVSP